MSIPFSQIFQDQNQLNTIIQTLFSLAFIIYLFYAQRLQSLQMLRQVEVTVRKIKSVKDEAKKITIQTITEIGKPPRDITPRIDR